MEGSGIFEVDFAPSHGPASVVWCGVNFSHSLALSNISSLSLHSPVRKV